MRKRSMGILSRDVPVSITSIIASAFSGGFASVAPKDK
jgi:hypothetical protein